ncbi:hypothetical protein [Actinomadura sp. 6K520]|uniref:hypothetical protein n=1 Tax=Actinomadura sp. 6K520 TaxID=2530364 RepID=UPI00104F904D|nr:hypothetical protein [Actinomadura sp. 6K520]TDE26840.1 hypothetical protein E1289_24435 [Actinomadura sp. 6K520]
MASLARVRTLLRCLAADHRLGGVLFFDLEPSLLAPLAHRLAEALPGTPPTVLLGPHSGDEGLWLRTRLHGEELRFEPGPLAADSGAVVIVPDLVQADPLAARSIVTMAGADAASAELLGHSLRWTPRTWWLAAAPRAAAGGLSPHLLDRFPIRVAAGGLRAEWAPSAAAACRTTRTAEDAALLDGLPTLAAGPATRPPLSRAAALRVVDLLPPGPSRRRDLALARVARVLAGLAGAGATGPAHVDEAAELMGLPVPGASGAPPEPAEPFRPAGQVAPRPPRPEPVRPAARVSAGSGAAEPVGDGRAGPPVPLPAALPDDSWPYPEDEADALPRLGTLRPAGRQRTLAARRRGRPLGVRPAFDLRDLAIVATVVEAAKYQRVRRAHRPGGGGRLLISPADLRRPRRQPEPGSALVLVLDHSCWRHFDRAPGMAAFLRRAHRDDSAVSVIELGHRDNPAELSAVRYRARSLLDPRVLASLNRSPGQATPLAHGLELAVAETRRLLRRGPLPISLVVATDGRGNVPLDDSLLGTVREAVGRRGVTAALDAAAPLRTLPGVRAVVLSPDVAQYSGLPFDLAEAMGGSVIVAPRKEGHRR